MEFDNFFIYFQNCSNQPVSGKNIRKKYDYTKMQVEVTERHLQIQDENDLHEKG